MITSLTEPGAARATLGWRHHLRRLLGGVFGSHLSGAGVVVLGFVLVAAVLGPVLDPRSPSAIGIGPTLASPSLSFPFGTDDLGRDVLSRVIAGVRVSLTVGVCSSLAAVAFGIVIGGVAGFAGGLVDAVLMRTTDVFMVVPGFFVALLLVALFGASLVNIIIAIVLLSWPIMARIVRSEVLSLRKRAYVDAARVSGASRLTLLWREILPNALPPVIVAGTLQVGQAILIEAGLSYLGLGDPSQISLGLMLQQSQLLIAEAWWTAAFPGLMIFLAVLGTNLVGETFSLAARARTSRA